MLKIKVGFRKREGSFYPCRMPTKIALFFCLSIRTRRNATTQKLLLGYPLYFMPENFEGISRTFSIATRKEVSYHRETHILMLNSLF
jgi:hypothetical protein